MNCGHCNDGELMTANSACFRFSIISCKAMLLILPRFTSSKSGCCQLLQIWAIFSFASRPASPPWKISGTIPFVK